MGLPGWVAELQTTCNEYLMHPWDRDVAADLWIENGYDLTTKIAQQQAEIKQLRAVVEAMKAEVRCLRSEQWCRSYQDTMLAYSLESEPGRAYTDHKAEYDRHTERMIAEREAEAAKGEKP
jgi:gamma-glutamyl phosphate reductase